MVSVQVVRWVSWALTQSSTRGPRMYESAVSTQSKGSGMVGWLQLLSL